MQRWDADGEDGQGAGGEGDPQDDEEGADV